MEVPEFKVPPDGPVITQLPLTARQPPVTLTPEARVEVEFALVCCMEPPERVSPAEERSPPPATESPAEVHVEVALPVTLKEVPVAEPKIAVIPEA